MDLFCNNSAFHAWRKKGCVYDLKSMFIMEHITVVGASWCPAASPQVVLGHIRGESNLIDQTNIQPNIPSAFWKKKKKRKVLAMKMYYLLTPFTHYALIYLQEEMMQEFEIVSDIWMTLISLGNPSEIGSNWRTVLKKKTEFNLNSDRQQRNRQQRLCNWGRMLVVSWRLETFRLIYLKQVAVVQRQKTSCVRLWSGYRHRVYIKQHNQKSRNTSVSSVYSIHYAFPFSCLRVAQISLSTSFSKAYYIARMFIRMFTRWCAALDCLALSPLVSHGRGRGVDAPAYKGRCTPEEILDTHCRVPTKWSTTFALLSKSVSLPCSSVDRLSAHGPHYPSCPEI